MKTIHYGKIYRLKEEYNHRVLIKFLIPLGNLKIDNHINRYILVHRIDDGHESEMLESHILGCYEVNDTWLKDF